MPRCYSTSQLLRSLGCNGLSSACRCSPVRLGHLAGRRGSCWLHEFSGVHEASTGQEPTRDAASSAAAAAVHALVSDAHRALGVQMFVVSKLWWLLVVLRVPAATVARGVRRGR